MCYVVAASLEVPVEWLMALSQEQATQALADDSIRPWVGGGHIKMVSAGQRQRVPRSFRMLLLDEMGD
jgi:hypothetical protein